MDCIDHGVAKSWTQLSDFHFKRTLIVQSLGHVRFFVTPWTGAMLGFPVAQLVKNLPAVWETWARSLGWEDPLEKGKATHSTILAWRIPWGHKESDVTFIFTKSTC